MTHRAGTVAITAVAVLLATPARDDAAAPTAAVARVKPPVVTPLPVAASGAMPEPTSGRLRRPTLLRSKPGGTVVARLGLHTEFGSPRVLGVARRHGSWLAVRAPEMPNNIEGWIPQDAVELVLVPRTLEVDLSKRLLLVRDRRGRVIGRHTVGIGAPGTPTPTGRYAVTDLMLAGDGSPYGCCVLALNGHQPKLPAGWTGGDRLAIHGTPNPATVGQASSAGCLRADERTLRRLMAKVPLGAQTVIHR